MNEKQKLIVVAVVAIVAVGGAVFLGARTLGPDPGNEVGTIGELSKAEQLEAAQQGQDTGTDELMFAREEDRLAGEAAGGGPTPGTNVDGPKGG